MNSSRILLVEDEDNIGSTLQEILSETYFVQWVKTVRDARRELQNGQYHLAILDVGLPDGNGFEVATLIREVRPQSAVMFLTAFADPDDRIKGLELGAEDYVTKPFHLKELLLRIQNVLKRGETLQAHPATQVKIGRGVVHFAGFTVTTDGVTHSLTHKECAILQLLYRNQGQVISRDQILNEAWGENEFPTNRTVDNFIMRLRRYLELDPDHPRIIVSVRGIGYRLDLEVKEK